MSDVIRRHDYDDPAVILDAISTSSILTSLILADVNDSVILHAHLELRPCEIKAPKEFAMAFEDVIGDWARNAGIENLQACDGFAHRHDVLARNLCGAINPCTSRSRDPSDGHLCDVISWDIESVTLRISAPRLTSLR